MSTDTKNRLNNADLGINIKKCPELEVDTLNVFQYPFYSLILYLFEYFDISNEEEIPIGCKPTSFKNYHLPPNSQCQLKETYLTVVVSDTNLPLSINGRQIIPEEYEGQYFYLVYSFQVGIWI